MTTPQAIAIRTDFDLETGRVSMTGRMIGLDMIQPNLATLLQGEGATFAVMVLSKGDRRPVDLALLMDGLPQQVDLLTAKMALKEFETGRRYDLHEGDGTEFALVDRDGFPRYRFLISLSAGQMRRILQSYADPLGTFVDVIAEIETQYRYNAQDYSPGATVNKEVVSGNHTVEVPVPLAQANGTRAYRLSVVATPLPEAAAGGWGAEPMYSLDQAINIVVSGGNVVAQDLSIPAVTRSADTTPSMWFVPHWVTSMQILSLDPVPGGLSLEIGIGSQEMNETIFGEMPATIWRAKGVHGNGVWSGGTRQLGSGEVFSFRDASGTVIGNHAMGSPVAAQQMVSHGVGDFYLFAARGNGRFTDFVWKNQPTAKFVRSDASVLGQDTPIVAETVPPGPLIRFDVTLTAQGAEEVSEVTRVSSQSFVVRLRRDLIPDVSPEPTS